MEWSVFSKFPEVGLIFLTVKASYFKSRENIQKRSMGQTVQFSNTKFTSVTLNELAMKAKKVYGNFKNQQGSQ